MLRRRLGGWPKASAALHVGRRLSATTAICFQMYRPPGSSGPNLPWYHGESSSSGGNRTQATTAAPPVTHTAPMRRPNRGPGKATAHVPAAVALEELDHLHEQTNNLDQNGEHVPVQSASNASASATSPRSKCHPQVTRRNGSNSKGTASSVGVSDSVAEGDSHPANTPCKAHAQSTSVVSGPSLDTRIDEIVKVEESLATEMLPRVVQLLIDPQADGIERITLSEFSAMQPKRQLAAMGGKKAWLEWLLESPYYQQVARLAMETPAHDLRALQQAGITTLYQWVEHPNLVCVSPRTRNSLDSAVANTISAYMKEVALVVNTSTQLEHQLNHWVANRVGKFVLDTLNISVDTASAAVQRQRAAVSYAGGSSYSSASGTAWGSSTLNLMMDPSPNGSCTPTGRGNTETLSPGESCTLEYYHRFVQVVLGRVRQDYAQQHATMATNPSQRGDLQAEAEMLERTYAVIGTALMQLLEEGLQHHLPEELFPLRDNGYLALERVPSLLKRAVSLLQLRTMPVQCFVFHSTAEARNGRSNSGGSGCGGPSTHTPGSTSSPPASATTRSTLNVGTDEVAAGAFLTGVDHLDVTLGEWSGQPGPTSSSSLSVSHNLDDPVQREYFSILHRLRRHVDHLAVTSLFDILLRADEYGGDGFSAFAALGLQQLFGPAKLVEDRLASLLSCPAATTDKPYHFIQAGYTCGKSALLQRLKQRTRPHEKAVLVRYAGSSTPFVSDLDDHPLAFPARFWFRVALASCPYLIRTEELYSRAPQSVMWWGHQKNWSWESYQNLIASANHVGWSRRGGARLAARDDSTVPQLSCVLVDDIDRVFDSMETKWGAALGTTPLPVADAAIEADEDGGRGRAEKTGDGDSDIGRRQPAEVHTASLKAASAEEAREQQEKLLALWSATGRPPTELFASSFAKLTAALGQINLLFAGRRLSPVFLTHSGAPSRSYFIPVASGIGLAPRLRVLPLMSTLHALHMRSHLAMSGVLYEVVKNCPALMGKTLEAFWNGRVALMDVRTGAPRLMQWSGTHHLLQGYAPNELFAELPWRNHLLQNPRVSRLRLVELLQRQLSSPTGYLTTGIDVTVKDENDGLVTPHNHTTTQVHPFALMIIFSHQDAVDQRASGGSGDIGSGGGGTREKKVVRAWAEVWAEYRSVVGVLGTTPARKRDALRVLLHGALLLRSAAVAGAQLDLNLKVPPYGFPLLASPVRVKGKSLAPSSPPSSCLGGEGTEARRATVDTVRKAISAYKSFFSTATQSHFPFRPMVGLNGGCDVVFLSGSTLALYDIVTTQRELAEVTYRFAVALLGVLHVLDKQVLPVDKIKQVHYVTVVSIDQTCPSANGGRQGRGEAGGDTSQLTGACGNHGEPLVDVFSASPTPMVPYYLDYSSMFEDSVMDRVNAMQEPLGMNKVFRTLGDLVDELERAFRVHVDQDVVSSHEELESLLSPTLMQLVPDATELPAYSPSVISTEDLMMEAMLAEEEDDGPHTGAEAEEVLGDELLARDSSMPARVKNDVLLADSEHVHQSAELLEAMLNDDFGNSLMGGGTQQMENSESGQTEGGHASGGSLQHPRPPAMLGKHPHGRESPTGEARDAFSEDSLTWLHDILTPESVLLGMHTEGGGSSVASAGMSSGAGGTRDTLLPSQAVPHTALAEALKDHPRFSEAAGEQPAVSTQTANITDDAEEVAEEEGEEEEPQQEKNKRSGHTTVAKRGEQRGRTKKQAKNVKGSSSVQPMRKSRRKRPDRSRPADTMASSGGRSRGGGAGGAKRKKQQARRPSQNKASTLVVLSKRSKASTGKRRGR